MDEEVEDRQAELAARAASRSERLQQQLRQIDGPTPPPSDALLLPYATGDQSIACVHSAEELKAAIIFEVLADQYVGRAHKECICQAHSSCCIGGRCTCCV